MPMATAPSGDDTLTPADAVNVLEELLPAQTQSYVLGLKLGLLFHEVDRLQVQYSDPRDRLLHTLIAFTKQAQPRPTWRVIVDALRSPAVNLPHLAERVEAAHFPDTTVTRSIAIESVADVSSPVSSPTVNSPHRVETTLTCVVPETRVSSSVAVDVDPRTKSFILSPVAQVEVKIKGFRRRFNAIKESAIRCLEKCCITVMSAVLMLTSIRAVDEHKVFLEEKIDTLSESKDHWKLFSKLNLYWNYLAFNLLDQFVEELTLKDDNFKSVAGQMAEYKNDLQDFRKSTMLELFCQTQPEDTDDEPPPGFKKIVVKHSWPKAITLEHVEKFRRCYARKYNLLKCAMMLHSIRTGSITVTWFVPVAVVEIVKMHKPLDVYKEFEVSRLEIADSCVYQTYQEPSSPSSSNGSLSTGTSSAAGDLPQVSHSSMAVPHSIPVTRSGQLTVQCRDKKTAPCRMERGSVTTDHQFAYFTPRGSNIVYSYQWSTENWKELPPCPYRDSALVIIDGSLTAVGGEKESFFGSTTYTKKLFTQRRGKWVKNYPPMNTARSSPAVVSISDGDYIVVIGGYDGDHSTTTVELFHMSSRRWYELTDLPQPLASPSATICGHQLHAIDGYSDNGYSCSLQALPSSDQPITSQSIRHLISWTSLPRLPVIYSTAATLCGQLVIIGGRQAGSTVNSIHQLVDGEWVEIGSMSRGRWWCLVVSPSPDKMMIVGGAGARDSTEECTVVQDHVH